MATEAEKNARVDAAVRTWRGEVRRLRAAWDQLDVAAGGENTGLFALLLATAELAVVVVEVEQDIDP